MNTEELLSDPFAKWVYHTLQKEDNPANRLALAEPHPLLSDTGKEAAEMAWDAQQTKINQLFKLVRSLEDKIEDLEGEIKEKQQ
jgi:hypothetical protein